MTRLPILAVAALVLAPVMTASAADPTYWQDVRPIFRKHCTVCHSERKLSELDVSAGLALDTPELLRKGSRGGKVPVLVSGKPDASPLVTLLTTSNAKKRMPLDADPLPAETVAVIRNWIAAGAPEGTKPTDPDAGTELARPARPVRKLPVAFATKAVLKTATASGPLELTLPVGPLPPVAAVAFSPNGSLLAVGTYGRVTIWDLTTAKPAKVLTNVLGAVNDLKFAPDGKTLAVVGGQPSARGDLRLFDTKDWKLTASLGGHLDTVSSVAWNRDGTRLLSASFDKTVRLWDVKAAKVLHAFTGHSDFVYAVAFAPAGDWYVTASKDRTGRIIDTATGKGLFTIGGGDQEILTVAVRPDGAQVITAGLDPRLTWWDAKTAAKVRQAAGARIGTHEIALDAKGTLAAAAGGDGTVRLYNPAAGEATKNIATGSAVFAVALDPAGKRAASGSADGTVRVWDTADGRLLATFWNGIGSGDSGDWLALTPEGYFAASEGVLAKAAWKAGGKPLTDAKTLTPFADPKRVAQAVAGAKLPAPPTKK